MERVICSVVASQLGISWARVLREALLVEDLGADSLDLTQIVLGIEEELEVEIADEFAEHLTCVGDVLRYLAAR